MRKMSRKPQVTRTFKRTVFTILCVNKKEEKVEAVEVTLSRPPKKEDKILKIASSLIGENLKPVSVLEEKVTKTTYGMDENFFLEHSHVIVNECKEKQKKESEE